MRIRGGGALPAALLVHAGRIGQKVIFERRNVAVVGCVEDVWLAFQALQNKHEKGGRRLIELRGGKLTLARTCTAGECKKSSKNKYKNRLKMMQTDKKKQQQKQRENQNKNSNNGNRKNKRVSQKQT